MLLNGMIREGRKTRSAALQADTRVGVRVARKWLDARVSIMDFAGSLTARGIPP